MKTSKTSQAQAEAAGPTKAVAAGQAKTKAAPLKSPAVKTQVVKAVSPASKAVFAEPPQTKPSSKAVSAKARSASSTDAQPLLAGKTQPPAVNPSVKASPAKKAELANSAKSMNATKVETLPSSSEQPATAAVPASDQLVRATRPSARLAQITVPSLPPAVASTAAKSSFLPSSTSSVASVPFLPIKKDPKLANNWKTKKPDELTDAEILAMPDAEYMNDTQMAFFRLKLTQLKQEILNSAGQTTEHLREDTVVVPDPADRATIEEEHALELRTRDRERKLLKKIEQSIARIDAGDYGFCDETGEAIGVGRLLARPTATLSLEAQQRRELKQKMFGD